MKTTNPYDDSRAQYAIVLACSVCIALLLFNTFLSTQLLQEYGVGIFLFTPFSMGLVSSLFLNYRQAYPLKKTIMVGVWSILIGSGMLVLVALEGVICVLMALPLFLLFGLIGSLAGFWVLKMLRKRHRLPIMFTAILINPLFLLAEHVLENKGIPAPRQVETKLLVHAPPQAVWQHLTGLNNYRFTSPLFKAGITYPTKTELIANEKGCFLRCNYTNGVIDMPLSTLEQNTELSFSLSDTPAPMKELTLYNDFHAPHLHGYFMVDKGSIQLIAQPGNKTLLVATTTYRHNIKPEPYWHLWSDGLLDQVHTEVLSTIKSKAEAI